MTGFILRRLVATIPVLVGISLISFVLVHLSGDPTDVILPVNASEEAREAFRRSHGLDQPLWRQYLHFLGEILQGEFGRSVRFEQPAGQLVAERIGATAALAGVSMLLAIAIGVPAGVVAAYRQNTATDVAVRSVTLVGQAVPNFYLGIVLVIVFSVWLRWLPTGGRGSLAAPRAALGHAGRLSRFPHRAGDPLLHARCACARIIVRTARAKGLGEGKVVWVHALRNAFIPVLTVIGLQVGLLMGGVVVMETIFSWPGVGRLAVQSIYARDFPVVQAVVFLSAVIFVVVNLVVDVLYAVLDPRISYR